MKLNNRGFTLVEMLVVIAIIILLIGLVAMVGVQAKNSAKVGQTAVVLENLNALLDEYSVVRGDQLVADPSGTPRHYPTYPNVGPASSVDDTEAILADSQGDQPYLGIITTLINSTDQHAIGDVVAYHGSPVTLTAADRLVRDAWGNYIWYQPSQPSAGLTQSTAKGKWVSAGMDGVFGTADDQVSGDRK